MSFATPRLNAGETIHVDGITLLKVRDDAIFFHQDYYDLGQMVYEHVPILKFIINKIKAGMRGWNGYLLQGQHPVLVKQLLY